jgi:glycosyltransferase involved in cell wall biosynthesis
MYSLIIPVFKNEGSIPELLEAVGHIDRSLDGELEVIFVVDGSPDRSFLLLREHLPRQPFASQLLALSRNFGSFAAIRAGLTESRGEYSAVMAADLQEPPELVIEFFRALESGEVDVVIGVREDRDDPLFSKLASSVFWFIYRKLVQKEMPPGGVDTFGCNSSFREHLLNLRESNSTLVGLLFWLGFRRKLIGYRRAGRRHGRSAWTLKRRMTYLADSILAFSDLPIRLLIVAGAVGLLCSVVLGMIVLIARVIGPARVPGYAATMLVILLMAAVNCLGLGVIGAYVWRIFENTKERPGSLILSSEAFPKAGDS